MSEEPEAELQATASLSPVSPSPVHTASPLVVPALQDTVDSIDAMVAAAAAAASDDAPSSGGPNDGTNGQTMRPGNGVEIQNGLAPGPDRRHEQQQTQPPAVSPIYHDEPGSDPQDFVDDDNDPYGDDTTSQGNAPAAVNPAPAQNQDPDDADDYAKIFDSPINPDEGEDADDNYPEPAQQHNVPPSTVPSSRVPATAAGTSSTVAPLSSNLADVAHSSSSAAQPKADTQPSIDLQKLLADLSLPNPSLSSSTPPEPSASHSAAAPASPPSSSLPPRPPQPNAAAQSYPAQHHPAGTSTAASSAPPSEPASPGMPPRSGKASGQRDGSQPGSRSNTRQQWSQYLNDERQYMTEAKWDRFPEGSRIFIGNSSLLPLMSMN